MAVETAQTPSGSKTTVHYERNVNCGIDEVSKTISLHKCDVAWEKRGTLRAGAFTYDRVLDTATLVDTVRGKPLRVVWHGYGEIRRTPNQNGNLLVESRHARGDSRWGSDRHVDPVGTAVPSSLYRRVTARTPAG